MPNDIVIRFAADTKQAEAGFNRLKQKGNELATSLTSSFSSTVKTLAGLFGTGLSIQVFYSLEKAVRKTASESVEAASGLARLRNELAQIAIVSQASFTEVSNIAKALLNVGLSPGQLASSIKPLIDYLRITGDQAELATDKIGTLAREFYGLSRLDEGIRKITELLIRLTRSSRASTLELLEAAFGKVASQARELGVSLDELLTLLATLLDFGFTADQAAQTVHQLFLTIQKGEDTFRKWGIAVRDSQGNLRPLIAILTDLNRVSKQLGISPTQLALSLGIPAKSVAGFASLIKDVERFQKLLNEAGVDISQFARNLTPPLERFFNELIARLYAFTTGLFEALSQLYELPKAIGLASLQTNALTTSFSGLIAGLLTFATRGITGFKALGGAVRILITGLRTGLTLLGRFFIIFTALELLFRGLSFIWESLRTSTPEWLRNILDPLLRSGEAIEKEQKQEEARKRAVALDDYRKLVDLLKQVQTLGKAGFAFVPTEQIAPQIRSLIESVEERLKKAETPEEREPIEEFLGRLRALRLLAEEGGVGVERLETELNNLLEIITKINPEFKDLVKQFEDVNKTGVIAVDQLEKVASALNRIVVLYRGQLFDLEKPLHALTQEELAFVDSYALMLRQGEQRKRAEEIINNLLSEQVDKTRQLVEFYKVIVEALSRSKGQTILKLFGIEAPVTEWQKIAELLDTQIAKGIGGFRDKVEEARKKIELLREGFQGVDLDIEMAIWKLRQLELPEKFIKDIREAFTLEHQLKLVENALEELDQKARQSAEGFKRVTKETVEALQATVGPEKAIEWLQLQEEQLLGRIKDIEEALSPSDLSNAIAGAFVQGSREAYSTIVQAILQAQKPPDQQLTLMNQQLAELRQMLAELRQMKAILQEAAQ